MKHYAVIASLVLALFAVACGDDDPADEEAAAETSTTLTVTAAFDGDVATGQNTVIVTVVDADAQPVSGAVVSVDPQMPMMGHGSTEVPIVTDNGDGTYTAAPVTFQMPGAWVVTIEATHGDANGELVWPVDVP